MRQTSNRLAAMGDADAVAAARIYDTTKCEWLSVV